MDDPLGAIVERVDGHPRASDGPLADLSFMAKDLFDVAGHATNAGNPAYAEWHGTPANDAWAVRALCAAGAELTAKTHTHELAYGLTGVNPHFGTPRNPHDPERIAGGSSSGSAAAVGSGKVPFALGTDTAGSIRLPASLCGIFGIRPTHGRIPVEGLAPLAPSLDTVGALAQSPEVLQRVARVLVPSWDTPPSHGFERALVLRDAEAFSDRAGIDAGEHAAERLASLGLHVSKTDLRLFEDIRDVQRVIGGAQVWSVHQQWIAQREPRFGWDVERKLKAASELSVADIGRAISREPELVRALDALFGDGDTLALLPSSPGVAPRVADLEDRQQAAAFRSSVLALVTPSSLGGLPAVAVPSIHADGLPVGVQLMGPRGSDERLLHLLQNWPPID